MISLVGTKNNGKIARLEAIYVRRLSDCSIIGTPEVLSYNSLDDPLGGRNV
jgi:hypothetical protein